MRSVAHVTLRREDGRIVCESVRVADTIGRRMRGLLGRGQLAPGEGMLLRPAWSIHTAFLRFPIDVVFVDPEQVVIRIEHELRPFKTASCRGAREVVELAAGECVRRGLELGDRVAWASRSTFEEGPGSESVLHRPGSRGNAVVASSDQRFSKLARFLLDGRGVLVTAQVTPDELTEALADAKADVVLLDAGSGLGDGLRLANAARAHRPDVPIVLVGDGIAGRAPVGLRIYDKWDETEAAVDAVEHAIDERAG
jgi:uncharacterized membrane protein (UPF0127 family)